MIQGTILPSLLLAAALAPAPDRVEAVPLQDPEPAGQEELVREFARQGVLIDRVRGLVQLDARICQVYDPLEYLLIARPRGKDHESLLSLEDLSAEALNAALLLLGVEPGTNGRILPKDPPITQEEFQAGVAPYTVEPARGEGVYIYVYWVEMTPEGVREQHFHRAEDLVLNVRMEQTYERGRWVYLGSRFIRPHRDAEEMFAADATGNLISLVYFDPANHLLTGADPDADNQYIWYPNLYLLPPIGTPVKVLLSRDLLEHSPPLLDPPGAEAGTRR